MGPPPPHPRPFTVGSRLDLWHTLVHVCQTWRHLVFASARFLDLRLHCTNTTPVMKELDIWSALPIVVFCHRSRSDSRLRGMLNINTALKCRDRVCEIDLRGIPDSLLKRFAKLKAPLPELTSLQLSSSSDENEWLPYLPVLPDTFLVGLAPRLQSLGLGGILFPEPQKLHLSSTSLVTFRLEDIPNAGYISPNKVVTCLSTLTKLEEYALGFRFPQSDSYPLETSQHPPPLTRSVLPALTSLRFRGDCGCLEVLISRIEVPLLDNIDMTFFTRPVFKPPSLRDFISRIESFEALDRADITFYPDSADITLSRSEGLAGFRILKVGILG